MPDLQTELNKVINTWNQTEMQAIPQPTPESKSILRGGDGSVGRAIFEMIKERPNHTIEEYVEMAPQYGLEGKSVNNYIHLFRKRSWGLVTGVEGKYSVSSDTYKTKNEMLGLPRGKRLSKAARRKILQEKSLVKPGMRSKSWLRDVVLESVANNPNIHRKTLVQGLTDRGAIAASVDATINTAIRSGRLISNDGWLNVPSAAAPVVAPVVVTPVAAPVVAPAPAPVPERKATLDVENLTLREARQLFDSLRTLFGPQA